ncbi:Actin-related protein 2/3 complex subunit 4 [Lithohypha guttulata]|uniref:RRM domain-containing protein n=1 Tax=Lithohypha guttulata TaxID=1690604 RepID=A0AAN7YEL1_9EURO|nr:hypothetical protein LTR51_004250 [Lithohypha guttulata]KAK5090857.1 hypothetical protein LTR05_001034 [Lithohypha guttulata]
MFVPPHNYSTGRPNVPATPASSMPQSGHHDALPSQGTALTPDYYVQNHVSPTYTMRQALRIPELSGYLQHFGKAKDDYKGKYLEYVLENKGIVLNAPPPFSVITDKAHYHSYGVVRINNIPFTISAQEISQFINRYAAIPMIKKNHEGYPIHIIMEKPTGKTMDCYVEFPNDAAAKECVKRFEYTAQPGRGTRLGTRNVTLDLSSQAELMKAIFPRARLVVFSASDGKPHIFGRETDPSWSDGFRGFVTLEEIYGVTRFAESPNRSPFVLKCHQRVYECMISTLYKFPWASTQHYTIGARNVLFEAVYKQLSILAKKVSAPATRTSGDESFALYHNGHKSISMSDSPTSPITLESIGDREVGLGEPLLFDLLFAAVNVPSFSLLQKSVLCEAAGRCGAGIGLSKFRSTWPFQTLEPASGTPDHVIEFWLTLFDSGYDVMTTKETKTTFEEYLIVSRNNIGFAITEWTPKGADLPFSEALRVEKAVMMQYIICGRDAWARERQLSVEKWGVMTLTELSRTITSEKALMCRRAEVEEQPADDPKVEVSPKSSGIWTATDTDTTSNVSGSYVDVVGQMQSGRSKFNPATATNFVPGSIQNLIPLNWQIVHNGHPLRLSVDTSRGYGGATVTAADFKNPFEVPASKQQTPPNFCSGTITTRTTDVSPLERTSFATGSESPNTQSPGQSGYDVSIRPRSDAPNVDFSPQISDFSRKLSIVVDHRHLSQPSNESGDAEATSYDRMEELTESITTLSPDDDPFLSTTLQRTRTQTLPNLGAGIISRSTSFETDPGRQNFGPIGSFRRESVAADRVASEGVNTSTSLLNQKSRAQSIPIATHNADAMKRRYQGQLTGAELWNRIGGR